MNKLKLITILALVFTLNKCYSQEKVQTAGDYAIDVTLNTCLDSNQTTVGMMECAGQARDAWDKELNKYYKLLMSKLTDIEKAKLKTAQKKWLEYRDTEFDASGTIYYDQDGTMWKIVAVNRQVEIVRQRALDLKSYYDNITFEKN
ncbi:hypothetical protein BH10BAC1_BH10BAC1_20000 [soil metagenome]